MFIVDPLSGEIHMKDCKPMASRDNKGKFAAGYIYIHALVDYMSHRAPENVDLRSLGTHILNLKKHLIVNNLICASVDCLEMVKVCEEVFDMTEGSVTDCNESKDDNVIVISPPKSLLFFEQLAIVAKYGADKYGDLNYSKGFDYRECMNSVIRHLIKYYVGDFGVINDEDTGVNHLCHIAANAMMLYENIEDRAGINSFCKAK